MSKSKNFPSLASLLDRDSAKELDINIILQVLNISTQPAEDEEEESDQILRKLNNIDFKLQMHT
jgi:hypothetical protein